MCPRRQEPEKAPAPEHSTTVTITAGQCQSFRPSSQRLTMRNDVTASAGNDAAAVMTHGLGSINTSKRHAPNNTARGKIQASYTDGEALEKAASNIHKKISAPAINATTKTATVFPMRLQASVNDDSIRILPHRTYCLRCSQIARALLNPASHKFCPFRISPEAGSLPRGLQFVCGKN